MNIRTHVAVCLTAIVLAAGCGGCGSANKQIPPKLTSFERDYFDGLFRFHPTLATAQGVHQYDGRLDNLSPLTVSRRVAELTRLLARLDALRQQPLSREETTDAQLINFRIRSELVDLELLETWRHNPLLYVELPVSSIDRMMKRHYAPASTRLNAIITSVHEIEAVMASLRSNVTHPPAPWTREAIAECGRLLNLLTVELPQWGRQAAGVNMRLRRDLEAVIEGATGSVRQSLVWLEQDLLPQSDGSYAMGAEPLVMKLLFDTMTEVPLDKLLSLAESNLGRDYAAFVEVAKQINPRQRPAVTLESAASGQLKLQEWIPAANRSLGDIRQFLNTNGLVAVPADISIHVAQTPPYLRSALFPVRTRLPALLAPGPRNVDYLLTPPEPGWDAEINSEYLRRFAPEEIELSMINSLLPGRYLHCLSVADYATRAGRFIGSRINLDGWSHYAEQMMLEEGYGAENPKLRLFHLRRSLVRDCRLLASIRLHARGMTLEQAASLFRERAFLGPELARLEAIRGTFDPEYFSQALGKMEILRLREDYRKAKGADYDLRKFHDEFLAQGALPIIMVRKQLLPGDQGPVL